ncbi:threonylcarbamoyladenosine tRNA methylthiotransferase-like [Clavelina lepadiformis]|uniref:threonylcarbamoyladenosine tRNA methylthiotransferase-like n=1 Tax=Clavelina lepadiformis TaxID=159417 RepID=UPI004041E8CB
MPSKTFAGLDDIEDLVNQDEVLIRQTSQPNFVRMRSHNPLKNKTERPISNTSLQSENNGLIQSNIPGTQSIYLKTWGCTHNSSDSEYMAGQLASYGYHITDACEMADLWLLNSCTVKNPAEDHFRNMVEKGHKMGKPVVVAGCVPQGAPRQEYIKGLSLIGVQQIDRVVEVVEETLKGNTVRLLGQKKVNSKKVGGASLSLPKIRRNPLIEIISINTGCLNACTYCKTKHARGELGSYPISEIVERAKQSFEEGVVEIWLTSEDTGAYGRDIGTSLPELLLHLVEVIPDGCMLRIGMTNPPYILEHLEKIATVLNHPRVYAFMHIPVQSGSDRTLYEMRREYTREDFCTVVDFLRSKVPGISIATDIICGFPTETEEDFEETMDLCNKYKFPSLFMNQFFARPGTPAARMPQINRQEIKKRTKKLSELFQSYEPYQHQLGKTQTVLVTEIAHDKIHYVGHNKYYEQVLVEKEEGLMGKMFQVKITETGKHYLRGKRVSPIISPTIVDSLPKGCVSGATNKAKVKKSTNVITPNGNRRNPVVVTVLILAIVFALFLKRFIFRDNNYLWTV